MMLFSFCEEMSVFLCEMRVLYGKYPLRDRDIYTPVSLGLLTHKGRIY